MDADRYQWLAMRTAADNTPEHALLDGALGLTGEAGEVADLVKKWYSQGHELNTAKLREELGDVCWYVARVCESQSWSMGEVLEGNIEKLATRYPSGKFTVKDSIRRMDEQ